MSEKYDYTDEETKGILEALEKFMSFSMAHMMLGNLGIAADDEEIVQEFVRLYKLVYCRMTGVSEEDAGITVIEEYIGGGDGAAEADSASGGSEADPWQEGGELRPGSRKLH